jgi:hypothetical protein
MAGPWEKYAAAPSSAPSSAPSDDGPWNKYSTGDTQSQDQEDAPSLSYARALSDARKMAEGERLRTPFGNGFDNFVNTGARGLGETGDQLYKGLTFGFGKDIDATLGGLSTMAGNAALRLAGKDIPYTSQEAGQAIRQAEAEKNARVEAAHPLATMGLQMAGGLMTPGVGKLGEWAGAEGLGLGQRVLRGAGSGALLGGVAGMGNADGNVVDRLGEAGSGALLGGVTGGALPVAGEIGGEIARKADSLTGYKAGDFLDRTIRNIRKELDNKTGKYVSALNKGLAAGGAVVGPTGPVKAQIGPFTDTSEVITGAERAAAARLRPYYKPEEEKTKAAEFRAVGASEPSQADVMTRAGQRVIRSAGGKLGAADDVLEEYRHQVRGSAGRENIARTRALNEPGEPLTAPYANLPNMTHEERVTALKDYRDSLAKTKFREPYGVQMQITPELSNLLDSDESRRAAQTAIQTAGEWANNPEAAAQLKELEDYLNYDQKLQAHLDSVKKVEEAKNDHLDEFLKYDEAVRKEESAFKQRVSKANAKYKKDYEEWVKAKENWENRPLTQADFTHPIPKAYVKMITDPNIDPLTGRLTSGRQMMLDTIKQELGFINRPFDLPEPKLVQVSKKVIKPPEEVGEIIPMPPEPKLSAGSLDMIRSNLKKQGAAYIGNEKGKAGIAPAVFDRARQIDDYLDEVPHLKEARAEYHALSDQMRVAEMKGQVVGQTHKEFAALWNKMSPESRQVYRAVVGDALHEALTGSVAQDMRFQTEIEGDPQAEQNLKMIFGNKKGGDYVKAMKLNLRRLRTANELASSIGSQTQPKMSDLAGEASRMVGPNGLHAIGSLLSKLNRGTLGMNEEEALALAKTGTGSPEEAARKLATRPRRMIAGSVAPLAGAQAGGAAAQSRRGVTGPYRNYLINGQVYAMTDDEAAQYKAAKRVK